MICLAQTSDGDVSVTKTEISGFDLYSTSVITYTIRVEGEIKQDHLSAEECIRALVHMMG